MRKTWIALLALATVTAAGRAQAPATSPPSAPAATPAAAPFDPDRNPLDRYLLRWEEAMKKVDTLALACTRKEIDKVYRTEKLYEGTVHFLKPTYFFWDMRVKAPSWRRGPAAVGRVGADPDGTRGAPRRGQGARVPARVDGWPR